MSSAETHDRLKRLRRFFARLILRRVPGYFMSMRTITRLCDVAYR